MVCCGHGKSCTRVLGGYLPSRCKSWLVLQEACKLYCLCQQPYNEDRPMLSCDYCQDWFHYDCIGLRAPSDDEDDEDVAPQDYRCPACCWKVTSSACPSSAACTLSSLSIADEVAPGSRPASSTLIRRSCQSGRWKRWATSCAPPPTTETWGPSPGLPGCTSC